MPSARASKNTMNAKADANTDRRANNENHISLLSSRSVVEKAKLSNSQLHICIFSMVNLLPEIYHWIAPILQACISSVTRTHFPAAPSEVAADNTRVVDLGQWARSPGCITLNGILFCVLSVWNPQTVLHLIQFQLRWSSIQSKTGPQQNLLDIADPEKHSSPMCPAVWSKMF